jgi:histidinol-phosphate aminotransferase
MMRPLVSATVKNLPPYQPGRSIEAVRRELGNLEIIKLASNESPFGPSPKALEAMRKGLDQVFRYPDDGAALREALGSKLDVRADQFVLGAGATDLIELCVRTFGTPGGHAVVSQGSFIAYQLFLRSGGMTYTEAPLKNWAIDLDAVAAAVTPETQLIFLPNPNNPTGSAFGRDELDRFLAKLADHVVLVLDDAYKDYHDAPDVPDALAVMKRRPRTVVLQSFSKVHGLAGMRVGYAIASDELVSCLMRVHRPFAVARLALDAAYAALFDHEHVERTIEGTRRGRKFLQGGLQELGFQVLPTQTNFVTFNVGTEAAANQVTAGLLRQGFIVRPLAVFGLPTFVRISVGTEPELKMVLKALGTLVRDDPKLRTRFGN